MEKQETVVEAGKAAETPKEKRKGKYLALLMIPVVLAALGFAAAAAVCRQTAESEARALNTVAKEIYRCSETALSGSLVSQEIQTGYGAIGNDEINFAYYTLDQAYYWILVTKDNKPLYVLVSSSEIPEGTTEIPTFEEQVDSMGNLFTRKKTIGCYSPYTDDYLPPYQHGQQLLD